MDGESGARRRETPRLAAQRRCRTTWTHWAFVDAGRLTHNAAVGGSNPPPATKARGPFSNRERAFCMWTANGYKTSLSFMLFMLPAEGRC
jgi:hypothetical protein